MAFSSKSLKTLVEGSSIRYKMGSRSYIFTCPRCHKKDKLYIDRLSGRFVCWVCKETDGFQGRPEYALTELLGLPVHDLQQVLYGGGAALEPIKYLDVKLEDFFGDTEFDDDVVVAGPKEVQWPWDYYPIDDPKSKRGVEYLAGRGIPLEIAVEYGIRYAPMERRVVFPVEHSGKLVGWQKRLVVDALDWDDEGLRWNSVPKVLSSAGIPRDRTLMFSGRLTQDHVVLCEGPVDALKAHLCGGNVATMGKAVSWAQLQMLRNAGIKRFYLALDPDAFREIHRLVCDLYDAECYLLRVPHPYKDLGEMSMEQVRQLFDVAIRVFPGNLIVFHDNPFAR